MLTIKEYLKPIVSFISDIRIYKYPFFVVLFGDISYKIKGPDFREIVKCIQPGDVLLRRFSSYVFANIGIPGRFSHAAIYVGDGEVIHMLGHGICKEDLFTFLRCDDVMILRLRSTQEDKDKAVLKAREELSKGVEYDYAFDTNTKKKFYCTEFVDYCFDYPVRNYALKYHSYILPDDFIKVCDDKFIRIWEKKK